jgi:hypothetical protein
METEQYSLKRSGVKIMSSLTFSKQQREEILTVSKARFKKNMNRHKGLEWAKVQARLEANIEELGNIFPRPAGSGSVGGADSSVATRAHVSHSLRYAQEWGPE